MSRRQTLRSRLGRWFDPGDALTGRVLLVRLTGSLRLIGAVYLASLLMAAVLFSVLEHRGFGDSLWWAVVTALTIGYGDIAPASPAGRVVSILFQHFWIFGIAPLVVANILTGVQHDENQFSHDEQEWQATSLRLIADRLGVELPPEPADTELGDVVRSTGGSVVDKRQVDKRQVDKRRVDKRRQNGTGDAQS